MKRKIVLSILFIISLLPMNMIQFGSKELLISYKGWLNITNPIGFIGLIVFVLGVWFNKFSKESIKVILQFVGSILIVISEINNYFFWNYPITSYIDGITNAASNCYPAFYFGTFISLMFILLLFLSYKNDKLINLLDR